MKKINFVDLDGEDVSLCWRNTK